MVLYAADPFHASLHSQPSFSLTELMAFGERAEGCPGQQSIQAVTQIQFQNLNLAILR